jgi:hypothetical protein
VVVRPATFPFRQKTSGKFVAGPSHGWPATHTGVIGPRRTKPYRPLGVVAAALELPAAARTATISSLRMVGG